MIVPTKMFIWVTPDENILGKSLEKKFLVFSFISPRHQTNIKNDSAHISIGANFDNHTGSLLLLINIGFKFFTILISYIIGGGGGSRTRVRSLIIKKSFTSLVSLFRPN